MGTCLMSCVQFQTWTPNRAALVFSISARFCIAEDVGHYLHELRLSFTHNGPAPPWPKQTASPTVLVGAEHSKSMGKQLKCKPAAPRGAQSRRAMLCRHLCCTAVVIQLEPTTCRLTFATVRRTRPIVECSPGFQNAESYLRRSV